MRELKLVGYYDSESEAISTIENLKRQGYTSDEISIISKNTEEANYVADETGTNVAEGAANGAVAGGLIGGFGGLLAGVGALTIPGIGPIIATGPILALITGAAAGAGVGGLAGALIGLGLPEEEANLYDKHFNEGKILILVKSDADLPNRPIV